MEAQHISHVKNMIDSFKTSLLEFASKHRDRINADPEFRHQFHVMCTSTGVDPLASNKGFWSDLLGVGDFYYELGVQIIQICLQTRSTNGGIISIKELFDTIRASPGRSKQHLSKEDIKRAIERISILGNGLKMIEVSGRTMVVSTPMELNNDHEHVFTIASEQGYVSEEMLVSQYGWSRERFYGVINVLAQEGVVWIDAHGRKAQHRYYFPSIWKDSCADPF
mmetsp:Transcript_9437/g.14221  ORF Transcript_9437/g.14221 Transcript_9437/m.14221 type:complete len:223 (+) Transcript_9437:1-669(+)